jgi:glutathione S-transferase
MVARLHTIAVSHFCEKARWALDRAGVAFDESAHLPVLHVAPMMAATRGVKAPVLEEGGELLRDSTAILLALSERTPRAKRLHPEDAAARAAVIALEDRIDEGLGHDVRRVAFHHLVKDAPESFVKLMDQKAAGWQRAIARTTPSAVTVPLRNALKLDDAHAETSERAVDAMLEETSAQLRGKTWLTGDTFTSADLTLAALLAPLLAPPEHPIRYTPRSEMPPRLAAIADRVRTSEAGRMALRAYREERHGPDRSP